MQEPSSRLLAAPLAARWGSRIRFPAAMHVAGALVAGAVVAGALSAAPLSAAALEVPPAPRGRVSDYASLLSPAAVQRIETTIAGHEAASSDQIAVAIFPSLDGESLEDFSIRLAERWQIGTREHDNGVILLVFVEDRRTRIEVGYGLEGRLTDALSSRILREVLAPRFRAGDYDGGVEASVQAIIAAIRGEYQAKEGPGASRPMTGRHRLAAVGIWLFVVFLGMIFFLAPRWFWLLVLGDALSSTRWGWSGRRRRGGFSGWLGGGGGGFGGFGGGGGGFGGGGASGRW